MSEHSTVGFIAGIDENGVPYRAYQLDVEFTPEDEEKETAWLAMELLKEEAELAELERKTPVKASALNKLKTLAGLTDEELSIISYNPGFNVIEPPSDDN